MRLKLLSFFLLVLAAASQTPNHGRNIAGIGGRVRERNRTAQRVKVFPARGNETPLKSNSVSEELPSSGSILTLKDSCLTTSADLPPVEKKGPIETPRVVNDRVLPDEKEPQLTVNAPSSIMLTLPPALVGQDRLTRPNLNAAANYFLARLDRTTAKISLPVLPDEDLSSRRQIDSVQFRNLLTLDHVNNQIIGAYFKQLPFFDGSWLYEIVDPMLTAEMLEQFKFERGKVYLWPLYHREAYHWTLLVVNLHTHNIVLQHYDPLKCNGNRSSTRMAAKILKEKFRIQGNVGYEEMEMPQQKNEADCGIFISEIGKRLVLGDPINPKVSWNGKAMRNAMAVELVTAKLYTD